jgi:UPF0716 protein FxsA
MIKLFLLFTLVPLVELWLLIEIGGLIGTAPTIIIVASTGFLGVLLARSQGLSIIYRIVDDLNRGALPGEQLFDGACILVGGAFLLTPGLLTDLLGFALLIPLSRRWIKGAVRRFLERRLEMGTLYLWQRKE